MMSDPKRVDPFGGDLDLSDFKPAAPKKPLVQQDMIRQVSEANNFPSRASQKPEVKTVQQRRRRTGRNVQFNIKAKAETIARFTALADKKNVPFGELLEQLLAKAEG
jgi:hypothetical protein